jgi:hypothetical protein
MMRMVRLAILVLLLTAAAGWLGADDTATKTAAPVDDIIFSHRPHAADQGLSCQSCHAADSSRSAADKLFPAMEVCGDCHDIEAETGCSQCHRNPNEPSAAPNPVRTVLFNHQVHIKKGTPCQRCHDGAESRSHADHERLPGLS